MKRVAVLLYGVVVYFYFFATFLYLIGFTGNLMVPKGIDGDLTMPLWQALLINTALVGLFALQHSVMARPWFKRWWTQYVPEPVERSTYVLFTAVVLNILFVFWQPLGGIVWAVEGGFLTGVLWAMFALGWAILLVSTFLINHFDLFGLRQVWLYFRGQPYKHLPFRLPLFYKWVRHPLYLGFILAFWAAPLMSITRLFLALAFTVYILRAIRWEEKDLITHFGDTYRNYARRVPMLFPTFNRRKEVKPVFETIPERK